MVGLFGMSLILACLIVDTVGFFFFFFNLTGSLMV